MIREIDSKEITSTVRDLFIEANHTLPQDVVTLIDDAVAREEGTACAVMKTIRDNLDAAHEMNVPICQDTGMAVVFVELGADVHISGELLEDAVNRGVAAAYEEGYLRKSVVRDPFYRRENTGDNTPAVLYTQIVPGDRVKITAAPKGFGSENMSRIRMFNPSAKEDDIVAFVAETVREAGGNPCPPLVVGVGIGGTFDYAALLSKKALVRDEAENAAPEYAALEARMLREINTLGIGPQGFGGKTTAMAVHIETYPTHIAGLPVAVNINCHVLRHASKVI